MSAEVSTTASRAGGAEGRADAPARVIHVSPPNRRSVTIAPTTTGNTGMRPEAAARNSSAKTTMTARTPSRKTRVVAGGPLCVPPLRIHEGGELADEMEIDGAGRTVALLADDELGLPLEVGIVLLVDLLAEEEEDDVGILLDRAGLPKVRKLRPLVSRPALLRRAGELRQCENRNVQLLGHFLERARDLGDLLLATLVPAATLHQLEVVHDDEVEPALELQTPA